jgi:hypothetical protein
MMLPVPNTPLEVPVSVVSGSHNRRPRLHPSASAPLMARTVCMRMVSLAPEQGGGNEKHFALVFHYRQFLVFVGSFSDLQLARAS